MRGAVTSRERMGSTRPLRRMVVSGAAAVFTSGFAEAAVWLVPSAAALGNSETAMAVFRAASAITGSIRDMSILAVLIGTSANPRSVRIERLRRKTREMARTGRVRRRCRVRSREYRAQWEPNLIELTPPRCQRRCACSAQVVSASRSMCLAGARRGRLPGSHSSEVGLLGTVRRYRRRNPHQMRATMRSAHH